MSRSRRFCFTVNNYTAEELNRIHAHLDSDHVVYGICGQEVGEEGTPHVQGFVIYRGPQRFSYFHRNACERAHLEVARGTSQEASDYCEKEGNFTKHGELPSSQGKRTDIERFKEWVIEHESRPSEKEIATEFPGLFLRYRRNLLDLVGHLRPGFSFQLESLFDWQSELEGKLSEPADDRSVIFCVDEDGGKGKTVFCKYFLSKYPEKTQLLSVGKRDDIAYAVDETKTIFLFDVPRGSMEYFQYSVVEKLKDQVVFSSKYESRTKFMAEKVHVVVFCNEMPNTAALTQDRYVYI